MRVVSKIINVDIHKQITLYKPQDKNKFNPNDLTKIEQTT